MVLEACQLSGTSACHARSLYNEQLRPGVWPCETQSCHGHDTMPQRPAALDSRAAQKRHSRDQKPSRPCFWRSASALGNARRTEGHTCKIFNSTHRATQHVLPGLKDSSLHQRLQCECSPVRHVYLAHVMLRLQASACRKCQQKTLCENPCFRKATPSESQEHAVTCQMKRVSMRADDRQDAESRQIIA